MIFPLRPAGGARLAASIPAPVLISLFLLLSPMVGNSAGPAELSQPSTDESPKADQRPNADEVFAQWEAEIQPLLAEHCIRCHGPAKRSSGLSLQSITELLGGGDRGTVIDHDAPEASRLAEVIRKDTDLHMPPEEQLEPDAVALLHRWVARAAAIEPERLQSAAKQPNESVATESDDSSSYPPGIDPSLVVDLAVQAGWQHHDSPIDPAGLTDDSTFVRRLYLDLIGRVPTAEERKEFLLDSDSRKRDRLIDRLLATSEHARHMAELFDAVLMKRGGVKTMRRRHRHGWIEFLTTAFAKNRPWNEVVREMLLARPDSPVDHGAVWYLYERDNEHQQIAEAVSRGVFGVQIQCAQCHDHPLAAEIKQSHYWGLVAFFNRGENVNTSAGPRVAESAVGGFTNFTNLEGESQPNRLVYLKTDRVDEKRPAEGEQQEDRDDLYHPGAEDAPRVPRFSRREMFVDRVLPDHPLVARAMVNRLWAMMMGRGLVHPVDQLDSQHPPSHPELLDWLTEDFEQSGYDVRRLLSQIARSDAYQRSSRADSLVDPARFAVAATKPLTAETLYRSILVALEVDDRDRWQTPKHLAEFRKAFSDVLPEQSIATLPQALLLTNGSTIHELLSPEHSGTIRQLRKLSDPREIAQQAVVRILGRRADQAELQRSVAFLEDRADRPGRGIDQLAWALLTSAEFRFNH